MQKLDQIKIFILIGVTSNSIGIILYLLLNFLNWPRIIILIICYVFVLKINYFLNKNITFKKTTKKRPSFYKFSLGYLNIFIFNIIFQTIFVDLIGLDHRIIQFLFLLISGIISFVFQKKYVFQ
tara:strand:- start:492 stop:863 length:372 start_codon:yes stop_codon:yes gene_type:complete